MQCICDLVECVPQSNDMSGRRFAVADSAAARRAQTATESEAGVVLPIIRHC